METLIPVYLEVRHDLTSLLTISNHYLNAFKQLGYHTIVICLKGEQDSDAISAIPADQVTVLPRMRWDPFGLRAAAAIRRLCRAHSVTLIVTHRFRPAYVAGLATLFHRPVPILAVIHGEQQFNRIGRRIAAKLLFGRPQIKLIGVSHSAAADIAAALPGKASREIIALPNCIDIVKTESGMLSREVARQRLKIDLHTFVVGTIGRLAAAKDQLTLIRAFHAAHTRMDGAVLVVIGDGRLKAQLIAEAEQLGVAGRILFFGKIDHAWRYMRAFDLFAATSVSEGFGLVIIEAMVAQRPIIATQISSFSEILGAEQPLYRCGDLQAISDAMVNVYHQTVLEREADGQRLYQRVERYYSSKVFRQRLMQIVAGD